MRRGHEFHHLTHARRRRSASAPGGTVDHHDGEGEIVLVRDLMVREVKTIGPDASLAVAAGIMRDHHIGCLPVLEGERLVGMITDRDIAIRGVAEGLDPYRAAVREVMSTEAITCSVEATVEQARELMEANLIKHLPVLDEAGRLVGILAMRDITGQFAKFKPHQVTFYRKVAGSSGQMRNVEVTRIYLSPAINKDEAVATALAKFEEDRGLSSWDQGADSYELEEGS